MFTRPNQFSHVWKRKICFSIHQISITLTFVLPVFHMYSYILLPVSHIALAIMFQGIPQDIQLLTVCFYHVTYAFQSESTLYSCLNVKENFARNRRKIWKLSDCSWSQTHNHLVRQRALNHLAKLWLNGWMLFVYELSACGFQSSCSHVQLLINFNILYLGKT